MNNKKKISIVLTCSLIAMSLSLLLCNEYKRSDRYILSVCLDSAGINRTEIEKALKYYPEGSDKHKAMIFLVKNMLYHKSYMDNVNSICRDVLRNNPPENLRNLWIEVGSSRLERPRLEDDLKAITADYLVKNIDESFSTWQDVSWSKEIDFEHYCKYILPYKVGVEPIVNWRSILKNKYSHLTKGIESQGEAYKVVFEYLENQFKGGSVNYPYVQDVLMIDLLQMGSCDLRTLYIVHVMRALGICAAYDYTPSWANYGSNSHSWVVLVDKNDRINTYFADTINYIDGSYEKTLFSSGEEYPYSIDSLKKIAKVYRRTFDINEQACKNKDEDIPELFKDKYTKDITSQYRNLTTNNVVGLNMECDERLFLCTYQQGKGWIAVGEVRKINSSEVDVGPLIHDNVVVVAKYVDGTIIPVSYPYIISHNAMPEIIKADTASRQTVRLLRKYMFGNRWTNRWGELIGTKIETSRNKMFLSENKCIYQVDKMPTEYVNIMFGNTLKDNYIRIMPSEKMYPVFAEIDLVDKDGILIADDEYKIYSEGKGLSGDSLVVKSLTDEDLMTTFYKRFPFWIGIDISKCKNYIGGIRLSMWNDMNQILPGNEYELFYFDKEWCSLGKKKAMRNFLEFDKVPTGALLLLRNYTLGKEERIFVYKNGKQVWW